MSLIRWQPLKVKLNLEEQFRITVAEQRQAQTHRHQTMHRRAEDALETMQEEEIDQDTRGFVTHNRQYEEHLQETAHMRAENRER